MPGSVEWPANSVPSHFDWKTQQKTVDFRSVLQIALRVCMSLFDFAYTLLPTPAKPIETRPLLQFLLGFSTRPET